jgi:hypothetical protein
MSQKMHDEIERDAMNAARAERAPSPASTPASVWEVLRELVSAIDAFDGKTFAFADKIERVTQARARARTLLSSEPKVRLTEERIDAMWRDVMGENVPYRAFARAIERECRGAPAAASGDSAGAPSDVEVAAALRQAETAVRFAVMGIKPTDEEEMELRLALVTLRCAALSSTSSSSGAAPSERKNNG